MFTVATKCNAAAAATTVLRVTTCFWMLLLTRSFAVAQQQQSAFVTITPAVLTLEHNMTSQGSVVTVRCSGTPADVTSGSNLYSLKLSRVLDSFPNATPTTLLEILHHNIEPQVIYPIEGATGHGSVTQNFLTLRMTRARCSDAAVYICQAAYLNTEVITFIVNDSLSVTVNPGQLSVSPDPAYDHWAVNNTVTLTCAGPLGSAGAETQLEWRWDLWDAEAGSWRAVDDVTSDVTTQPTNQLPCYKNGSSTLDLRLRLADSRRSYRCYVQREGVPFLQFAGVFQFGHVLSLADVAAESEEYERGMAVGAGIGVGSTVAFVLIVVFVCLCCRQDSPSAEDGIKDSIHSIPHNKALSSRKPLRRSVAAQTAVITDDDDDDATTYDVVDNALALVHGSRTSGGLPRHDHSATFSDVVDAATAQKQQAAAEEVLQTLLATRYVTSWRMSGEGGPYMSFTLFLAPSASQDVTYLRGSRALGRWHKKKKSASAVSAAAKPRKKQERLPRQPEEEPRQQHRRGRHRIALPQGGGDDY